MEDDEDDEDDYTCGNCEKPTPWEELRTHEWLCSLCSVEVEANPVWQAIRRVERGEVTVRRRTDVPGLATDRHDFMANYGLETSDGWLFEIFPDGIPFEDWDYIDAVIAPDGTRWDTPPCRDERDLQVAHPMPRAVWTYSPGRDHARKWALDVIDFKTLVARAVSALGGLVTARK